MKILAIEFSSPQRSVAIAEEGQVRSRAAEAGGPETRALALVEQALREAGWEREQIECLAVGLGPGSYTGIRAAIALAQGWQLAREVRLLGISSVEVLAAGAQTERLFGRVNLVIDAQRNEFYLADYEAGAAGWQEVGRLRLVALAEVGARLAAGEIVAGPDVNRWFSEGRLVYPDAAWLARLAARRDDFAPGEKLEPIYLRATNFVKAPAPRIIN